MTTILNSLALYSGKIILAIIAWIVGKIIIKLVGRFINSKLEHDKVDPTVGTFLKSFATSFMYLILALVIISTLGFQLTSLVAVLGAASLAVGLALQGSLANFAGGVLLLIFRPFSVGDYIKANGEEGTVKEIQLFATIMDTVDNKRVIIPNGQLSNHTIINYSKNDKRRVDFTFGVGYNDDLDKAKEVLENIFNKHELILKEEGIFVKVSEYADSSINFTCRVWANTSDYWTVYFDVLNDIKGEFDKAGLNIPYPQMDVHVNQ